MLAEVVQDHDLAGLQRGQCRLRASDTIRARAKTVTYRLHCLQLALPLLRLHQRLSRRRDLGDVRDIGETNAAQDPALDCFVKLRIKSAGDRLFDGDDEIVDRALPFAERLPRLFGDCSGKRLNPFVGARLRYVPAPGEEIAIRGDVGGFGAGSKFTWQAMATYNWLLCTHGPLTLDGYVGWRALSVDYETGEGYSRYEFDVLQHGPVLGLTGRF